MRVHKNLTTVPNDDACVIKPEATLEPQKTPSPTAPVPSLHHRFSLAELSSPVVVQGVAYWTSLRGQRRFPARKELSVRSMAPFLKQVALIEVVNGGEDYCFRLVGDAHVQARGHDFKGETIIGDVGANAPSFYSATIRVRTARQSG